jgi:peptidoglycan/LPS O-acetylase OafA/YrhL
MKHPNETGSSRMASLDLLRLIAALAVVFFHYCFRGEVAGDLDAGYPAAAPFAIFGYLGVNLFFLISGFVISWSAEGRNWEEFAIARFVRLYPGFLVCMTLTFCVLVIARDHRFATSASTYAANLTMFAPAFGRLAMDGVYWSIMLEVVFYSWFAALMFIGAYPRRKLVIIAVWLAISAANEFFIGSGALRVLFITAYSPFFIGGILAFHVVSRGASASAILLLALAFALSCKTIAFSQHWMQVHYGVALSYTALLYANAAVHATFVGAILLRSALKPSPAILMLGGLTYPLYLLHQFVGYILLNRLAPHLGGDAALGIVLVGMLFASYAVWRFVEVPIRRPLVLALRTAAGRLRARLLQQPTRVHAETVGVPPERAGAQIR